MKKYILLFIAFLMLTVTSCKQDLLETPELEVSVAKTSWSVGEEITFDFIGNPHFITFYSGVEGHDYDAYSSGATSENGESIANLETRVDKYVYSYSEAGTYTATFIAASNNIEGVIEKVIQINLTITE